MERWKELDELNELVDELEEAGIIKKDGPQFLYELLMQGDRKRKIKTYEEVAGIDKKK